MSAQHATLTNNDSRTASVNLSTGTTTMIPKIKLDDRADIHEYSVATADSIYVENRDLLKELFVKSLWVERDEASLFRIQWTLLSNIVAADAGRRKR